MKREVPAVKLPVSLTWCLIKTEMKTSNFLQKCRLLNAELLKAGTSFDNMKTSVELKQAL